MTTAQETTPTLPEKAEEKPAGTAPKKAAKKSTSRRRRGKPAQRIYDHIPIIILLVVIFSFTLLCIGVGLTRYLDSERAGIPACGRVSCPSPFSSTASQKGGGE
ncbi:MAG: hypothetical protein QTN59_06100 [Candidatus Electrothrix communis]|nr:MAG: hypothetical protein QTN59_06100 [Candidatus Electrothrix communis]